MNAVQMKVDAVRRDTFQRRKAASSYVLPADQLTNHDALVKRLNRLMRPEARRIAVRAERSKDFAEFGRFSIVDGRGVVVATHVDIEHLARSLGVLRDDDVRQSPLGMTLEQAEATLYAARERLADAVGFAAERQFRQDAADALARVEVLRKLESRA